MALKVLVLCTGNSCRSQMAEGFFRAYGHGAIDAYSAGLEPKGVNSRAIEVMNEVGIDISGHTSNNLKEYQGMDFDLIVTVCDNAAANCPVFPGKGLRLHWPFSDPAEARGTEEEILNEFRRVRDQMEVKIRDWIAATSDPSLTFSSFDS